jgi:hypothetical protein
MRLMIVPAIAALIAPSSWAEAQQVRDSAGVRIVTHSASARPRTTWKLDPKPLFQIGGADGTGPTEFSEIWDASRTRDGGVVVSDEPEMELRVFDARGQFLRKMGRKGAGPGEFFQIKDVMVYGDTIYAIDTRRGTAVFLVDGTLVRHPAPPSLSPYHAIEAWGSLPDGSSFVTAAGGSNMRAEYERFGTRIEMRAVFLIAGDARSAKLLEVVPTYEHFRANDGPPGGDLVAFSPMFSAATYTDGLCVGRPVRYEIRCMDLEGKVRQIIRRDTPVVRVTKAARDAVIAARSKVGPATAGHSPPSAAQQELMAQKTPFAETYPAYDWLFPGRDGVVWVADYDAQRSTRPYWEAAPIGSMRRWNVFSRDGVWLAQIELPSGFLMKEAGLDYVLGVVRDKDGVPTLIMYRLLRN